MLPSPFSVTWQYKKDSHYTSEASIVELKAMNIYTVSSCHLLVPSASAQQNCIYTSLFHNGAMLLILQFVV